MLVGAAIARRAPSARVGACWLRRALPKPGSKKVSGTFYSLHLRAPEMESGVRLGRPGRMRTVWVRGRIAVAPLLHCNIIYWDYPVQRSRDR